MVHQENVGMIVTLVHKIPGDCCLYFPAQVGCAENYGNDIQVQIDTKEQESDFAVHRTIRVTDTTTQTTKIVNHYHFTGWEDWQLPTGNSRSNLATLIEQAADFVTINSQKAGLER